MEFVSQQLHKELHEGKEQSIREELSFSIWHSFVAVQQVETQFNFSKCYMYIKGCSDAADMKEQCMKI